MPHYADEQNLVSQCLVIKRTFAPRAAGPLFPRPTLKDPVTNSPAHTPAPSGYATDITLFASRYQQGGRTVYSLDLSPRQIIDTISEPNVDTPSPGNRAIRPAHADGFAKYLREREDWVSPSVMLRTPKSFEFEISDEIGGIQFGVVHIPRRSVNDLHIVDGQHRILGMFRANDGISRDLDKARANLSTVLRVDPSGPSEQDARGRIAKLEGQRERLDSQRVNVQIFVESDLIAYRQMFFDIADNALGITASVKSRFDSRKVVHRSLPKVMEHQFLKDRVDPEGDRFGHGSNYIMGAKHVAEIIRTINVGLDGRVSARQEEELKESHLVNSTTRFLNTTLAAIPELQALSASQISADEFRATSLLGSVLFFRVMAGVMYELVTIHEWTDGQVQTYFANLAPHLEAPVHSASIWLREAPIGLFADGSRSPNGRRQDLKALKDWLVGTAREMPEFLIASPSPTT